jgi:Arc/MetJ family transcription regulator
MHLYLLKLMRLKEFLMRTTLSIDDQVMQSVMQATGRSNPLDAVRDALQSYLQEQKLKKVIALRGKVQITDNWRQLRALDTQPASK